MSRQQRMRQVAAGATAMGVAVALGGAHGALTATTDPATAVVQSGALDIALAAGQSSTLTTSYVNTAAGDRLRRTLAVRNAGDVPVGRVTMSITPTAPGVLVDGPVGLRVRVQDCPGGWAADGGCPAGTKVIIDQAMRTLAEPVDLPAPREPGQQRALRLTVWLPTEADNAYQNKTAEVTYRFTATQAVEP